MRVRVRVRVRMLKALYANALTKTHKFALSLARLLTHSTHSAHVHLCNPIVALCTAYILHPTHIHAA